MCYVLYIITSNLIVYFYIKLGLIFCLIITLLLTNRYTGSMCVFKNLKKHVVNKNCNNQRLGEFLVYTEKRKLYFSSFLQYILHNVVMFQLRDDSLFHQNGAAMNAF